MVEYIGTTKKQGSIVEVLKEEILSGRIPGGSELTQNELAEALGVSRMPVREALIILEYQGLMERLPNNHVRVAEFSDDYFERIFRLCAELEAEELNADSGETEVSDELVFHRQLCRRMSHSFLKKTLETMIDIYVFFAASQDRAGTQNRCGLLAGAVKAGNAGDREEVRSCMQQYFDELSEIIRRVRK